MSLQSTSSAVAHRSSSEPVVRLTSEACVLSAVPAQPCEGTAAFIGVSCLVSLASQDSFLPNGEQKRPKWLVENDRRYEGLDVGPAHNVWCGRDAVMLRGLRAQGNSRNFLHDLLNLRYLHLAKRAGVGHEDTLEGFLSVDTTQGPGRQRMDGSTTLMNKTSLYMYHNDRVATAEEHALLQGWDIDFSTEHLTDPMSDANWQGLQSQEAETSNDDGEVPKKKRRRPQRRKRDAVLRELFGSGMCLSEAALLTKAAYLAMDTELYQHPASDDHMFTMPEHVSKQVGMTVVDPDKCDEIVNMCDDAFDDDEQGLGNDLDEE